MLYAIHKSTEKWPWTGAPCVSIFPVILALCCCWGLLLYKGCGGELTAVEWLMNPPWSFCIFSDVSIAEFSLYMWTYAESSNSPRFFPTHWITLDERIRRSDRAYSSVFSDQCYGEERRTSWLSQAARARGPLGPPLHLSMRGAA